MTVARHVRRQRSHRARQPGQLLNRLALGPEGNQEARYLRLGGLAVHYLREHLRGLLRAQVFARGQGIDRAGEDRVGHVISPQDYLPR